MASRETIEMDYTRTIRQAERLESMAAELRKSSGDISESMDRLSLGWQSESADKYRVKGERLSQKVEANAKQLKTAADLLRNSANRVRQAELASLRLAEMRIF